MRSFCIRIQNLVLRYARFNQDEKLYENQRELSFADKQEIKSQLFTLFSNYLTSKGVDDESIDDSLQELESLLSDTKTSVLADELFWLNGVLQKKEWGPEVLPLGLTPMSKSCSQNVSVQLSLGSSNQTSLFKALRDSSQRMVGDPMTGSHELKNKDEPVCDCLYLLQHCRETLRKKETQKKKPEPLTKTDYDEVKDLQSLQKILYEKRLKALTRTQAAFIDSVIALVNFFAEYNKISGESKLKGACLYTLPSISSSCCLGLYFQEIALLYLLLLAINRGGAWLEGRELQFCQGLGRDIRGLSKTVGYASSSLFISVVNVNFNAFYALYSQVRRGYERLFFPEVDAKEESPLFARSYNHLALKVIDLIFEEYIKGQKKQWVARLRTGESKSYYIGEALKELQEIDKKALNQEEALSQCLSVLKKLEDNPLVNVSNTTAASALAEARKFCQSLIEDKSVLGCDAELQSMGVRDNGGSILALG